MPGLLIVAVGVSGTIGAIRLARKLKNNPEFREFLKNIQLTDEEKFLRDNDPQMWAEIQRDEGTLIL